MVSIASQTDHSIMNITLVFEALVLNEGFVRTPADLGVRLVCSIFISQEMETSVSWQKPTDRRSGNFRVVFLHKKCSRI